MSRKRDHEGEKENSERWLLTYSDLITLLLIFFVVMYSMSKVDVAKFQALADSLNKALSGGTPAKIDLSTSQTGSAVILPGTPQYKENTPTPNAVNKNAGNGNVDAENMTIESIKAKLDKFAADNGMQSTLVSSIEERGLVVSIQETLLFESGSADITSRARDILDKITTVLAPSPNQIKVEGHTDNLPINTSKFPSNWELSVTRATNVVQILQGDGITPDRLSATGYGEYRPLYPNDSEAGRAKNRRIDLVILRTKYDVTEPASQASVSQPVASPLKVKP